MSKFAHKDLRYRKENLEASSGNAPIQGEAVAMGQAYHLDSEAQFKRDLEQSLAEIVKKRLQEAEDEAIALVQVAEQTAQKNACQLADEILGKARAEAKEMVEVAQSQVDSIQEAAREEGFKSGFQEGYADATAQVEQEATAMLQSAQLLAENAYQAEKLILKNYDQNALAIIRYLGRKVLHQELAENPEILLNQVQQAIESLYLSGKIKLVLNPQVLQELRGFSAVTQSALDQMSRFEFVPDPLLDSYQLFIVGEEGAFDLSVDTQIDQVLSPLKDALSLPKPDSKEALAPELLEITPETSPESAPDAEFQSPLSDVLEGFDDLKIDGLESLAIQGLAAASVETDTPVLNDLIIDEEQNSESEAVTPTEWLDEMISDELVSEELSHTELTTLVDPLPKSVIHNNDLTEPASASSDAATVKPFEFPQFDGPDEEAQPL